MKIQPLNPLSEDQIRELEQKLGFSFPADYRKFLREMGGGLIDQEEDEYISAKGTGPNDRIYAEFMCGYLTKDYCNILYWMERYGDEMPKNSVIIGCGLGSGFFVLQCEEEDQSVWYWDDEYHFAASDDEGNAYWVADSFTEFMKKLGISF